METLRVIPFLKQQHNQIKTLFSIVASSRGKERADRWLDLRRLLAIHESAEEIVVHPQSKKKIPNGDLIVQTRLREENEAKKLISEMDSMDCDSPQFASALDHLTKAVIAHAEAEEREEFMDLDMRLDKDEAERMKRAVEMAESIAPTRPHPHIGESASANMLLGPFAAMVDRARDAMMRSSSSKQ